MTKCEKRRKKKDELISFFFLLRLRWCWTGRFATKSFSATQRCNVGIVLPLEGRRSQQCCKAVLRQNFSLRIVPRNITISCYVWNTVLVYARFVLSSHI